MAMSALRGASFYTLQVLYRDEDGADIFCMWEENELIFDGIINT